ncbi:MAG TPA: deoxyribodipyrimidine photolyase, partial [Flavobacterium sp.]|nr:deoxyribodipyrimidine photolyase [Flavobacterium sp.]
MNIVWFKRDLRLYDNEALFNAIATGRKVLLLYIFEPSLLNDIHYSKRHFDFIKQSLESLQKELLPYHTQILIVQGEVMEVFEKLNQLLSIHAVYSHQETGIKITFDRDISMATFFKSHNIPWFQSIHNGVIRGIKNRKHWNDDW